MLSPQPLLDDRGPSPNGPNVLVIYLQISPSVAEKGWTDFRIHPQCLSLQVYRDPPTFSNILARAILAGNPLLQTYYTCCSKLNFASIITPKYDDDVIVDFNSAVISFPTLCDEEHAALPNGALIELITSQV